MTERERLIKLIEQCSCHYSPPCTGECCECYNVEMYDRNIEHIADHLLANGVIVPPVNIGQTVWFMSGVLEEVCEAKVIRISMNFYTSPMLWFDFEYFSKQIGAQTKNGRIDLFLGKTVFLTREEAEKALEGQT